MINAEDNPVEWALFIEGFDETSEHLSNLIEGMVRAGRIDDEEFEVGMAHIYAHLNRLWHSRTGDCDAEKPENFPEDLTPVG